MLARAHDAAARVHRADARALRALGRRSVDDVLRAGRAPWMAGQDMRPMPWQQSASFTPKSLSGCVLWLRADMGVTLNGSTVSAWADQSGLGHNVSQGTAADQPPYVAGGGAGGSPYLNYNGATGNAMSLVGPLTQGQPFEVFAASSAVSPAGAQSQYLYDFGSNQNACFVGSSTSSLEMYDGSIACAVAITNGAPFVSDAYFNGASSFQTINGSVQSAGNIGTSQGTGASVIIGNYGGLVAGWIGRIYEVVAYGRALAPAEREQVIRYMGNRYGIAVT